MADKTIGQLSTASSIGDSDLFVLEQSGVAKNLQGVTLLQAVAERARLVIETLAPELAENITEGLSVTVTSLPAGSNPTASVTTDARGNVIFTFGIPAANGTGVQSVDGVSATSNNNVPLNAVRYSSQSLTGDVITQPDGSVTITGQIGQVFTNLKLGTAATLNYNNIV